VHCFTYCQQKEPKDMATYVEKSRAFVAKYGLRFMVVHMTLSVAFLTTLWFSVAYLVDLPLILLYYGYPNLAHSKLFLVGGSYAVALGIHKLLMPVRLALSAVVTGVSAKYNRENSVIVKVFGELVDKDPVLRSARDKTLQAFSAYTAAAAKNKEKEKTKEDNNKP